MLQVIGRTDLSLKQEYFKIIIRVAAILIALPYGIYYIAFAELISTGIHFFINNYYPKKLFNYGAIDQLKDISKIILSGVIMSITGYLFMLLFDNHILKLVLTTPVVIITYIISIKLFKVKELDILLTKLKSIQVKK